MKSNTNRTLQEIFRSDLIRQKAIDEILRPSLDLTKQFLQVLTLETEAGQPVIASIRQEETESVVYFRVQDEKFFIAVYLELEPVFKARWTEIESGSRVEVETLRQLADWNIELDMDLYAGGTPLK